jgi:hypothetical protein
MLESGDQKPETLRRNKENEDVKLVLESPNIRKPEAGRCQEPEPRQEPAWNPRT